MGLLVNIALIKCNMKYVFSNLPQYALQIFRNLPSAEPCGYELQGKRQIKVPLAILAVRVNLGVMNPQRQSNFNIRKRQLSVWF